MEEEGFSTDGLAGTAGSVAAWTWGHIDYEVLWDI